MRGVGVVRDSSSDGDGRRRRQTLSGSTGGGVRDSVSMGEGGRWERGNSEAERAAE